MVQILSTRGRAPKELLGVGAELGGVATRNRIAPETVTVLAPALGDTELHQHGAEATDVGLPTFTHDTSNHRYARIEVRVTEAGAPGAVLQLQYRRRSVGGDFLPAGGPLGAVEASLAAVGDVIGGSVPLTAQCTGDCEFRVVPAGGDGSASPCIENLYVKFMDIPLPASTPIPEPSPDGCTLGDLPWFYHDNWVGYSSWANVQEEAEPEWGPKYAYLHGGDSPDYVYLDSGNPYAGHPILTSYVRNSGFHAYWQSEFWEDPVDWWPALPDTRMEARLIVKFDGDWTALPFGDNVGTHYNDGFIVLGLMSYDWALCAIAIHPDGVFLKNVWQENDYVKLCDIADLCDGTWKELRLTAEFSLGQMAAKAQWGPACGDLACQTLVTADGEIDEHHRINAGRAQFFWSNAIWAQAEFGWPSPNLPPQEEITQSWSVAEWGILREADASGTSCP